MKIANHNQALDEHARLISSLSPLNMRGKLIRAKLLTLLISEKLPPDIRENLPTEFFSKPTESFKFLNKLLGEKTMEKELQGFIDKELSSLRQSQTIFCSENIVDEIQEASETMLDDVILPQDVFTPDGIIFLEKPYNFVVKKEKFDDETDLQEEWEIHAIMVTHAENRLNQSGIGVMLYGHWKAIHFYDTQKTETTDQPDSSFIYNKDTKSVKVLFNGKQDELIEELLKKYENKIANTYRDLAEGSLSFIDGTFFQYGENTLLYPPQLLILKRFLLSFFRLTYEYLEVETHNAERSFQKRAKRSGINIPEDGYITVMSLRRKIYNNDTEGEKRNSPGYAFRVRGHWKKQYIPSRKLPVGNPGAYKHLYINDYIKGKGVVVRSKRLVKVGN